MAKPRKPYTHFGQNLHIESEIVESGLCVRCGACGPACPVDIISFDEANHPRVRESDCLSACTRCLKVCPGGEVDFAALDAQYFGVSPDPASISGIVRRSMVSFSTDHALRKAATSGGFVTRLLCHMLASDQIDGALVLGVAESSHWREKSFIARTDSELRSAIKSKYRLVPHLTPLSEMEKVPGRYAIVGLPCHLHALHKYMSVTPKLRKRVAFTIGLFCNVAFEPRVFDELCEFHHVSPEDVVDLQFRGGAWPGGIHATLKDGTHMKVLKNEEMKDEFNLLKKFYTPERCNMCIDFSAEYCDLACGDPWLRGPDGEYLFTDDRTTVITRSERADQVVDSAVAAKMIEIEEIPLKTFMVNFETSARYKREFVPANIEIHRKLGHAVPHYSRQMPPLSLATRCLAWASFLRGRVAQSKWLRMLGLRLAQTPLAIAAFRFRRRQKAEQFAARYAQKERFVAGIEPPPPPRDGRPF